MNLISSQLQRITSNGTIRAAEAQRVASKADEILTETYQMLAWMKTQVGTDKGAQITELMNRIEGVRFDAAGYHYDKVPEGQE